MRKNIREIKMYLVVLTGGIYTSSDIRQAETFTRFQVISKTYKMYYFLLNITKPDNK